MNLEKYPRVKKFMDQHPNWSFDECYKFIENQLEKKGADMNGQETNREV